MAWSTPRTWVTGEMVTAALMNTYARDNLVSLRDQVACKIRRAGVAVSCANGVDQTVDMDVTDFDSGGMADLTNNWIVFPVSGKYVVGASLRFLAAGAGSRWLRIFYKDNTALTATRIIGVASEGYAASATAMTAQGVYDCKAGDAVYLVAFQNSGAALNYTPTVPTDPCLYVAREGI